MGRDTYSFSRFVAVILASAVVGCGGGDGPGTVGLPGGEEVICVPAHLCGDSYGLSYYQVNFIGTDFSTYAGTTVHVQFVRASDGFVLQRRYEVIPIDGVGAGEFGFNYSAVIGETVYVDYYVDRDGNRHCDYLPTDPSWRSRPVTSNTAGESIDIFVADNSDFSADACASLNASVDTNGPGDSIRVRPGPYKLTIAGSGFAPHAGRTMEFALLDPFVFEDPTVFQRKGVTIGSDGTFLLDFVVEHGEVYELNYYVDVNADGLCDGDYSWWEPNVGFHVPPPPSPSTLEDSVPFPPIVEVDFWETWGVSGDLTLSLDYADISNVAPSPRVCSVF